MEKIQKFIQSLFLFLLLLHATAFTNPLLKNHDAKDHAVQYEVANQILNDLKQAKGLLPSENPILIIPTEQFSGTQKLAVANLDSGTITLDPKSYLICRSLGKDSLNALAFLLGHELGHFIHEHAQVNHYIEPVTSTLIHSQQFDALATEVQSVTNNNVFKARMQDIITDYNNTYNEAEADFEGAFLGYLAGYNPMLAGRRFLDSAYIHMNLDTVAKGYPSLDERLEIIRNTSEELTKLTPIFEMANYLIAVGQYQDAIPYLEEVLLKFQSREIYNNLGVIYLLQIQSLSEEPITKYKLPITLEAKFQAPHPQFVALLIGEESDATFSEHHWGIEHLPCHHLNIYQKQLDKAQGYFNKAIGLDSDFEIAYLNSSITQTLKAKLYDYNTGLYLSEDDINKRDGRFCNSIRDETYDLALQFALQARRMTLKKLEGITAEYFEFPPSDTLLIRSLPGSTFGYLPQFVSFMVNNLGENVAINEVYAYKKEVFNKKMVFNKSFDKRIYVSAHTIWNTSDNNIPEQAITLSNIYTQIDLVKILLDDVQIDTVSYHSEYGGLIKSRPFDRALEIHSKNKLAQFNQSVFLEYADIDDSTHQVDTISQVSTNLDTIIQDSVLQDSTMQDTVLQDTLAQNATILDSISEGTLEQNIMIPDSSSQVSLAQDTLAEVPNDPIFCQQQETFQGFTLDRVDEIIQDWNTEISKEKLRVIPYYTSNYGLKKKDMVLKHTAQNVSSSMKYKKMLNFEYFKNITSIDIDNKEEKTIFLIPKIDSASQTICGVNAGSSRVELESAYGKPFSELQMSNGIYLLYKQSSEIKNYVQGTMNTSFNDGVISITLIANNQTIKFDDPTNIPQSKSINGTFYYNVNELEGVSRVDLQRIKEQGIIFKLDRKNEVVSWGLYRINKKSELELKQ